jgi:asparagine synthase (glutamine-hydrolysing)
MPGICGIAGQEIREKAADLLAEMVRRMRHHPWYVEDRYLDAKTGVALGRAALGLLDAAAQPAANDDRTLLAVMAGEVYDASAHRRTLEAAGCRFRGDSQAELLLRGYERQGAGFFRDLNGMFAAALWDVQQQRLVLVNDRFGMKPLYYVVLPGQFLFASEIKALLAHSGVPRTWNPRGIAQFFTFGHLFGEDTLFEAVRLLPAAGWLTYDLRSGRVALERYWRPGMGPAEGDRTEREILDRLDAAFKRAVDRRTHGPAQLGLALSGGLDARTILAAVDADRPLTTITMGIAGSIDHRSAERMAKLAERPHHPCMLSTQFLADFPDHLWRMVHLTDGHYLSQCIVMPTLPVYRDLGVEVLLRGHAGELMHMDKAYNFSLNSEALHLRDAAALEDWLFRRLRTYMVDAVEGPVFLPEYQERLDDLARDALHTALGESAGVTPPVQSVWRLFLSQRLRRETALSLVKFGSVVETRLPYLDNDLVDLLLAAPPELKLGDTIQAHILRRRMPALLGVVNANTGTRLGAGRMTRLFSKFRLKVLAKLGVPGYQPYERLGRWLREELRPLVGQLLLSTRHLERGLFHPETIRAVVADHLSGRRNHTFLLMALMIFEVGQRQFVDGEGSSSVAARGTGALPSAAPAPVIMVDR